MIYCYLEKWSGTAYNITLNGGVIASGRDKVVAITLASEYIAEHYPKEKWYELIDCDTRQVRDVRV